MSSNFQKLLLPLDSRLAKREQHLILHGFFERFFVHADLQRPGPGTKLPIGIHSKSPRMILVGV